MSERVLVAMSGGVDSSVAAALLVEQGCEVIGVTMRLAGGGSRCCSLDDVEDARRVAARLGIRFYVADYAEAFRRAAEMQLLGDRHEVAQLAQVHCARQFIALRE